MAERRAARRRARRRVFVVAVAVAVLAAGAGTAWALTSSSGPQYRLASVERADVQQTVDADGTLSARDRATLAFGAAGTVSSVRVSVGDQVDAGEIVATLDPSALQDAVTSAKQTLAQAQQRLAGDEQAQADGTAPVSDAGSKGGSSGSSGAAPDGASAIRLTTARADSTPTPRPKDAGSGSTGSGRSAGAGSSGANGTSANGASQLADAQNAVEKAQEQLDAAVQATGADVATASSSCAGPGLAKHTSQQSGTVGGDGTVAGTAPGAELVIVFDATSNSTQWQAPDGNAGYSFAGMTAGDKYTVVVVGDEDASCSQALAAASRDQAAVTDATTALKRALTKLDSALATLPPSGSAHSGGTASKGATGARSGASGGSGSGNSRSASGTNVPASGSASGAARTVTAERIAADTQAVDAAKAQLTVARHDVGYATLISPIAGTVGSISLRAGQSVGRSSSTATIVVVGSGALTTEVDIPLAQIDLVRSGQTVQVTVDGRSQPLAGKVTYVGTTNASSSTGSAASYPVTVTLNAVDSTLFDGMGASVAIDVGTARQVLTVPLSAVHTAGSLHTVQRYADGKATLQRVALGVQGGQRVQVTSGLSLGDRVVLADIGAAVPSSTNGQRGGFGGLSGGGFGGGSGGGFGGKPAFVIRPGR